MVARVKKNDRVYVLSGRDRGKEGQVLEVLPDESKVLVKNVGIVTRHYKARRAGEASGIKKMETPIDAAKVMPVCPSCDKPCRIKMERGEEGKLRTCNRCGKAF